MAQQPRFKPATFVKQEAYDNLLADFHEYQEYVGGVMEQFNRAQVIFETALVQVLQDVEGMSDVLVSAGLLVPEDAEIDPEDAEIDPDDGNPNTVGDEDENEPEPAELAAMEVAEDAASRAARQAEARGRRAAAVQAQGLTAFEQANESDPIEAETDANSISGLPEEGVVVDGGRDPFTGERLDDTVEPWDS